MKKVLSFENNIYFTFYKEKYDLWHCLGLYTYLLLKHGCESSFYIPVSCDSSAKFHK